MINFFVGPLNTMQPWVLLRSAGYGFCDSFSFIKHPFNVLLAASVAYDIKKHNSSFLIANCTGYTCGYASAVILKNGGVIAGLKILKATLMNRKYPIK